MLSMQAYLRRATPYRARCGHVTLNGYIWCCTDNDLVLALPHSSDSGFRRHRFAPADDWRRLWLVPLHRWHCIAVHSLVLGCIVFLPVSVRSSGQLTGHGHIPGHLCTRRRYCHSVHSKHSWMVESPTSPIPGVYSTRQAPTSFLVSRQLSNRRSGEKESDRTIT